MNIEIEKLQAWVERLRDELLQWKAVAETALSSCERRDRCDEIREQYGLPSAGSAEPANRRRRNRCQHKDHRALNPGSIPPNWLWCPDCGATKLVANYSKAAQEKHPRMFHWNSPKGAFLR